ncbi:hypothetical protein C8Q80DRAFT_351883 [Daedaleopsis nitida]|nr:hypothetical protein C8Q80DRAFT_351883 [Daedaleopsis nitida]
MIFEAIRRSQTIERRSRNRLTSAEVPIIHQRVADEHLRTNICERTELSTPIGPPASPVPFPAKFASTTSNRQGVLHPLSPTTYRLSTQLLLVATTHNPTSICRTLCTATPRLPNLPCSRWARMAASRLRRLHRS